MTPPHPFTTTTTTSDSSSHPRAPFKMTIVIDSLRPNYDLSAVGMRWMKSRCNWGGLGSGPVGGLRKGPSGVGFWFCRQASNQRMCECLVCIFGLSLFLFFFLSNEHTSNRPLEQTAVPSLLPQLLALGLKTFFCVTFASHSRSFILQKAESSL